MASAPHPSSRSRQTWRERARPNQASPEAKSVKRWLLSLLAMVLVAILVWRVWILLNSSSAFVACLPVDEYKLLSVPPIPYALNDSRAFTTAGIACETLSDYRTYDSMRDLDRRLGQIVSRPNDTLVLYVAAHGVSIGGRGYLLCSDFDMTKAPAAGAAAGCLEIGEFFRLVSQSSTGEKIVLLDSGHLPTAPRLGMLVNEFPKLLAQAVPAIGDEKLWVLSSNSLQERSHVSHAQQQSLFNYFAVRGLSGEADLKPQDGMIDLAELVSFIGWGVSDYLKADFDTPQTQTPQLHWGGGDLEQAKSEELVAWENRLRQVRLPRSFTIAKPEPEKTDDAPAAPEKKDAPPATVSRRGSTLHGQRSSRVISLTGITAVPAILPSLIHQPASDSNPPAGGANPAAESSTPAVAAPQAATAPTNAPAPADKTPPAENSAKPAEAAAKPEPPDNWSALRGIWSQRDQRLQRSGPFGWTPIDYAPQLWREYENLILYHELRAASRPRDGKPLQLDRTGFASQQAELESRLAQAKAEFENSPAARSLETADSAALRSAVQLRNEAIYRAVDLVAWQARENCGVQPQSPRYAAVTDFLRQLAAFEELLRGVQAEPTDASRRRELVERAEPLRRSFDEILSGVHQAAEQLADFDGNDVDATGRVEDLLSTPLLTAPERIKLLAALERSGKGLNDSRAARRTAQDDPRELLQMMRKRASAQASNSRGWDRARDQAQLEALLIRLADPETADRLEKQAAAITPAGGLADAERSLAEYFQGLANRLRFGDAPSDPLAVAQAERELRLIPLASISQLAELKNPIPRVVWSAQPERGYEFAGFSAEERVVFRPGVVEQVRGSLESLANYTGEVKLSLHYNPRLLRVTSNDQRLPARPDETSGPLSLAPGAPLSLNFEVSPARPQQPLETELELVATSAARPEERYRVTFVMPRPKDIQLVIAPVDSQRNAALVWPGEAGRQRLSTFPGHRTSFVFSLSHQSGQPRRVGVELFGLDPLARERIAKLPPADRAKPEQLKRAGAVLLAVAEQSAGADAEGKPKVAREMTLPKTDEAVPIPFRQFFPPPAPAAPPAAGADAPPPMPERAAIAGGMVCVVRDLEHGDLEPWVTWIDLAPWAPKDYLQPTVSYSRATHELTIDLALAGEARPQDGQPIKVRWDVGPEISPDRIVKQEATLGEVGVTAPLKAVTPDELRQVRVKLDVDGYPRAFVYQVKLDANYHNVERERALGEVEVVRPLRNAAFGQLFPIKDPEGKIVVPFALRVSAPEVAFRPSERRDWIEVGIDENNDGRLQDHEIGWRSDTARKNQLWLDQLSADGLVVIDSLVSDFEDQLRCDPGNDKRNFIAQLVWQSDIADRKSVPIMFDTAPPTVRVVAASNVNKGESLALQVSASDNLSGAKSVSLAYDQNRNGQVDPSERQNVKPVEARNEETGVFTLEWPTENMPLGDHTLLVWATDRVELESVATPARVDVRVRPKPAAPAPMANRPAAAPAPPKGAITASVVYGEPIANFSVTLTGPMSKSGKTDASGRVTFRDLPPGDYKLEAKGIAKNTSRKGEATITVPSPPPKQPLEVPIKLQ